MGLADRFDDRLHVEWAKAAQVDNLDADPFFGEPFSHLESADGCKRMGHDREIGADARDGCKSDRYDVVSIRDLAALVVNREVF